MDIPNYSFVFLFTSFLLFLSLCLASSPPNLPHPQHHEDEAFALLQFKQSLTINKCDPSNPAAYPKLESWKTLAGRSNCCSWDGVECDDVSGHVISLDLSSSFLYGSLSFNTTLSKLPKLAHLNLANNHFNHSSIPSMSGLFPELIYLNLSFSHLSGSVPSSISQLSSLSLLHLSGNDGLKLKGQTFHALVQHLTRLEYLLLGEVDISSTVPKVMVNLSSLRVFYLRGCGLHGQFPAEIFNLQNLESISLYENLDLTGSFPEFNSSSKLESLFLDKTRFSGLLPSSIGNLHSLEHLGLRFCSFSGQLPTTLQNLTQLSYLDLGSNNFGVTDPSSSLSWLGMRTKLDTLDLDLISLSGEVPAYLSNLTQLTYFSLHSCLLTGSLPSWLSELNNLQYLDLSYNQLQGHIPNLFSQLPHLSFLQLSSNLLSGTVELDMFLGLEELTKLFLSDNRLSLIHNNTYAIALGRRFISLGLGSCNLQHIPQFLGDQDQLNLLDLSYKNISGQVPFWLCNVTKDTLEYIDLRGNFLSGFEMHSNVFPWPQANFINLQDNMLRGQLPIPPTNTIEFCVSGNNFSGQISPEFCTLSSLYFLDLSYNKLSGEIPQCLANSTSSLQLLNLRGNKFHGTIPQTHTKSCNLKMLVLDGNNLTGKLPKSLSNCSGMEFLSLGDNQIEDVFPAWLGFLQHLEILILRANRFYGELKGQEAIGNIFPKLRIIDISWNNLSGSLPTRYFIDWKAMETEEGNRAYVGEAVNVGNIEVHGYFMMILTNKGIKTWYNKSLESFVAIDFSGNRFDGQVPISIGNLRGLHLLNLSNNILTGPIPSSLANLSNLESLDLLQNNISGEIPAELADLTFLSSFNVSHNHLTGSIPHGNQFDVFQNDSYLGNLGLCGKPLSKQCGNSPPPPPSLSEDDDMDEGSLFHFGWEPVAIGYACGFVLGAGLGYLVNTRKRAWVMKIFGEKRRWRGVVRGVGQWDR